jgi:HIV-1 Vpr-binding protein
VWDLRTLKLQRSVPCLDSTCLTWNVGGDCAYATLRRASDDLGTLLHPKRAKHPLHTAFRTVRPHSHLLHMHLCPLDARLRSRAVDA